MLEHGLVQLQIVIQPSPSSFGSGKLMERKRMKGT